MKRKEKEEKENRMIGNNIIINKNIKKEMVLNLCLKPFAKKIAFVWRILKF